MNGYSDPRLPKYALPAKDPSVAGQYKELKNGIAISSKDTYVNFSEPNFTETTQIKIIDGTESYFLRAEGVLRRWNMGSGGKIPPGEFIKRLTYPTSITNASRAAVDAAVSKYLNNDDSPFTAIWWDID